MAILSTNTAPLSARKATAAIVARLIAALRPAPESPEHHRIAEFERAAARMRVDRLLL